MIARVLRDYRAQYPDPIALSVGETVVLGAHDSAWPEFIWGTDHSLTLIQETGGWWWCENARQQQGWLPATHLYLDDMRATRNADGDGDGDTR